MPINPLNFYFKHFEKHRELPGVKKEPLSAARRDGMIDSVEMNFRTTLARDNGPDDLDPVGGHVLSTTPKGVNTAAYSLDEHGKHLRLHTVEGPGHFLSDSHLSDRGLDMLGYTSAPGLGNTLLCFHSDLTDPANDFVQRLDLPSSERVPPAADPFPNCSRWGLR